MLQLYVTKYIGKYKITWSFLEVRNEMHERILYTDFKKRTLNQNPIITIKPCTYDVSDNDGINVENSLRITILQ